MVAISQSDAESFLARPGVDYFIFLIFGPDRGLVSERLRQVSRGFSVDGGAPAQQIELAGDAIAADPLILVDEANSIDMFQQSSRIIRINVGAKSLLPALDMVARAPPRNCWILLEAGDLRRDAPLRKWVEMKNIAAAIECRQDDARSVLRLLEQELIAANRTIEPSARDALLDVLGEDRLATRNEIEKLLLFSSAQSTITVSDVEDICHDPNLTQTDALVDGFFSLGRQDMLDLMLNAHIAGADPTIILLAMMRHALALHRGVGAVDVGANPNDALQLMLRHTGGYSRKAELIRQLRTCNVNEVGDLVRTLQMFTKAARKNPTLLIQRLTRLLLSRPGRRQKTTAPAAIYTPSHS
jgi:DNA polymerase-3 subunit delta